ncbi:MAG: Chromosomal replication initiator protein DnaA [Candidatus Amesbacteria bacterium GW2011_GWC1_48_10]|mgnify:CR=1 FL=1|uniref:Chromosomal replication initiator protein DnaA n=1 Tax=Candidatus Amesbacteria bacterium GW2011_GWC1_48_10 TaxID=1618365 RepID=A0A0G1UKL7_9BACT|nr:MAG: Chromosomal replication initiator protein DnaA [Candidatus Amesbacteria bacterium GW2011_GWC1_48_10]
MTEVAIDKEKTWDAVLQALRLTVSTGTYNTYIRQTELLEIREKEGRLICEVGCSSAFVKIYLEQRCWGQIMEELERVTGKRCELILKVGSRKAREQETGSDNLPLFEEKTGISDGGWKRAKLKADFTFENYAVAGSNQMAFAAAQAVARKIGEAYNPLFIYGGVGVGKTHLMQAIGHEVLKNDKGTVLFCSGEEFTNDLVEAIRFKATEKIRSKYRKVKALLIDDVQFIAGKPGVQEEFFHTFNAIQREGGQVVMTSDRPPTEISKLEERLRSRFGAGLIVDIGPADFELRTAILLIKSRQRNIDLPMEAAQAIAERIEGVRELEGFLVRLATEAEVGRKEITQERIDQLLKVNRPTNGEARVVTPAEVISAVGEYYRIGTSALKGERRTKMIAWPRQILMYFLRHELKLPLEEVGRILGGRDHTTVMHGSGKVKLELETNPQLKTELGEIKKRIFTGDR